MVEHHHSQVSADLIWEISRDQNSFLVKRRSGGGVQFSRDPLNLINKHSRKHVGFINDKAVGIKVGEKGGIVLGTKKSRHHNRPASNYHEVTYAGNRSNAKVYKSIVSSTAKQGYRSDLREHAVARASALRHSSRPVKESPEKKLRGPKANKATEKD